MRLIRRGTGFKVPSGFAITGGETGYTIREKPPRKCPLRRLIMQRPEQVSLFGPDGASYFTSFRDVRDSEEFYDEWHMSSDLGDPPSSAAIGNIIHTGGVTDYVWMTLYDFPSPPEGVWVSFTIFLVAAFKNTSTNPGALLTVFPREGFNLGFAGVPELSSFLPADNAYPFGYPFAYPVPGFFISDDPMSPRTLLSSRFPASSYKGRPTTFHAGFGGDTPSNGTTLNIGQWGSLFKNWNPLDPQQVFLYDCWIEYECPVSVYRARYTAVELPSPAGLGTVSDEVNAVDKDPIIAQVPGVYPPMTYATLELDHTVVAGDYAQLHIFGLVPPTGWPLLPFSYGVGDELVETSPPARLTLSNIKVHVTTEYLHHGAAGSPIIDIAVFDHYETNPAATPLCVVQSDTPSGDLNKTEHLGTISPSAFSAAFGGAGTPYANEITDSPGLFIRCTLRGDTNQTFGTNVELRVFDAWIEYFYDGFNDPF